MAASAKQVAYIAALDAKVAKRDWAWLTADDAVFGPGTYGRHLQRQWANGTLCGRGASDLIGLYKRALEEAAELAYADYLGGYEVEARLRSENPRSYRDAWAE